MTRLQLLNKLCPIIQKASKISIKYIPYAVFAPKYRMSDLLGRGSFGEVYKSGTDYAIKIFRNKRGPEPSLHELMTELNAYATHYHPCILRPIEWSYDFVRNQGYVVMPQGKPLREAYIGKLITIEQIISDTLSAIGYMNQNGYAHCDIKPDNMVYYNGLACIIDMGLFRKATLFSDNKYRVTGSAYTYVYRDPRYLNVMWNNISVETYALAKSYYDIMGRDYSTANMLTFDVSDPLLPDYPNIVTSDLNLIFKEVQKPADQRATTYELLTMLPKSILVRTHIGDELDKPSIPFNDICAVEPDASWKINMKMKGILCDWLIEVANKFKLSAQQVFATFHLLNKILNPSIRQTKFQAYGCACVYIAVVIYSIPDVEIRLSALVYITAYAYESSELLEIIIEVMRLTDGMLGGPTAWDYASCEEDLFPMLEDIIRCDYDATHTRKLLNTGNSKDVSATKLYDYWITHHSIDHTDNSFLRATIPYESTALLRPVNTPWVKPIDVSLIMQTKFHTVSWSNLVDIYKKYLKKTVSSLPDISFEHITVLLLGKDANILKNIPQESAVMIYGFLRSEYKNSNFNDSIISLFNFDFTKYSIAEIIAKNVNPFVWDGK